MIVTGGIVLLDRVDGVVGRVGRPQAQQPRPESATAGPPPLRRREPWISRYRAVIVVVDVLVAAVAGALVLLAREGLDPGRTPLFYASVSLAVVWPLLLSVAGAYDARLFGTGSDEYRSVSRAGLFAFAAVGFTSYAFGLELSRALVAVAVPGMWLATLLARHVARRRLRALRASGRCTKRTVVVGRAGAVLSLVEQLQRERFAGLEVVAACVTPADRERFTQLVDMPVGTLDDVVAMAAELRADTIAVTSASETAAQYLRQLSWQLEGSGLELLVAPGLVEVAGPRLHIRPFEGLPLLSVEEPRFTGWRRVVKGLVDRSSALVGLVVLSPVLLALAVAVRVTSDGPVLYRQERVGLRGGHFTMLKFRSMVADADRQLDSLVAVNESDGLLFKVRDDPRITSVGRWMRRFSLDELPQLFNVLDGTMSLVGPRPPLPGEVARYDDQVSRRLLVKPGLTGLWQISGRSDLTWEDAVRLDLRYVENWSLAMDVLILWKTGRAVLSSSGAY